MQRLRALTEAAADAIVSGDAAGLITDWNPAAQRTFGYARDEIVGRSIETLLAARSRDSFRDDIGLAASDAHCGPDPRPRELVAVRRSGEEFPVDVSLASWQEDGRPFFTAILRDISRDKEIERRLETIFGVVAGLLSGHVLEGRYKLERVVRSDAFGSLYEAVDLEQRVPVMVRLLRALLPEGAREVASPSPHPHAADILAVGVTDIGLPYAVIEPLSGESISDRVRRGRAIAPAEAMSWGLAVAEALADAHDHGEVHGRLCAGSLFLHRADTPAQSLKLLGFEISELVPSEATTASGLGSELGPFCAPECAAGVAPRPASDVFSYTVVLGVLFSGRLPPTSPDDLSMCEWLEGALPLPLAALALRALDPDPDRRPRARVFAATLGRLQTGRV